MLTKQRRHFRNARNINGQGIFSDILGKVTGAVTSDVAKKVAKKTLEGATQGLKSGAEYGARELTKKAVNKIRKPIKLLDEPVTTKGKNETIDDRTRQLLDSLKSGSGIKTIY